MSLHENHSRENDLVGGSNRSFGLIVGGILTAIGLVRAYVHWGDGFNWLTSAFWGIGLLLVALGLVAPAFLGGLNRIWTKLGLLLGRLVNPIILGLIYLLVITPVGLILRLTGYDPLNRKIDSSAPSYWVDRDPPGPAPDTMTNLF